MIYALSVVIWVHAGLTGSMDYLGFKPMIVHIQVSIWHVMTEVALCKLSMASEASLLQDGAEPGPPAYPICRKGYFLLCSAPCPIPPCYKSSIFRTLRHRWIPLESTQWKPKGVHTMNQWYHHYHTWWSFLENGTFQQFETNPWLILTSKKWCLPCEHCIWTISWPPFSTELMRKPDSLFNRQDVHSYGGRPVAMRDADIILLNVNNSVCVCPCVWVCVCVHLCVCVCACVSAGSHIWPVVTSWTLASQAPLPMGFPRGEYWSRLPFPPPGDPTHISCF